MFFSRKKKDEQPEENNKPDENFSKKKAINYKFRDLKIHSSDEWMADSTKKYRKVFERSETTYLRVEFSFFNKLFDEEDWEASFRTKCFFINEIGRASCRERV